jgi:hypothetical protein
MARKAEHVLRSRGWGVSRLPGERKRMDRLTKKYEDIFDGIEQRAEQSTQTLPEPVASDSSIKQRVKDLLEWIGPPPESSSDEKPPRPRATFLAREDSTRRSAVTGRYVTRPRPSPERSTSGGAHSRDVDTDPEGFSAVRDSGRYDELQERIAQELAVQDRLGNAFSLSDGLVVLQLASNSFASSEMVQLIATEMGPEYQDAASHLLQIMRARRRALPGDD